MRISRHNALLAGLVFMASACSVSMSTANLSSVKLGKDKAVSQETSTFATTDTIYGVPTVSNSISKMTVKGQLIIEDVEGQTPGPIPGLVSSVELDGSGSATFTFSPPEAGWPEGKYKLDVVMLDEGGVQKDQKTVSFTVQ